MRRLPEGAAGAGPTQPSFSSSQACLREAVLVPSVHLASLLNKRKSSERNRKKIIYPMLYFWHGLHTLISAIFQESWFFLFVCSIVISDLCNSYCGKSNLGDNLQLPQLFSSDVLFSFPENVNQTRVPILHLFSPLPNSKPHGSVSPFVQYTFQKCVALAVTFLYREGP